MNLNQHSIVITGAKGKLGSELCRHFAQQAVPFSRQKLDVTERSKWLQAFPSISPKVIIHTAAYTQVDLAENEVALCWSVNVDSVRYLIEVAETFNALLVFISSDYVFGDASKTYTEVNGTSSLNLHPTPYPKPWREIDFPVPESVYSKSKFAGEQLLQAYPKHLILRTCGLYGESQTSPTPSDFVSKIITLAKEREVLKVVDDQICSPTYIPQLTAAIKFLVDQYLTDQLEMGTYHLTNQGEVSWFEFAQAILSNVNRNTSLQPISSKEFNMAAKRPSYSPLNTSKYSSLDGPKMSHWSDALEEYFQRLPEGESR